MLTKKAILEVLKKIPDPELGISIVDLGLIYDVKISKNNIITVVMTLTSQFCPLFEMIQAPIKSILKKNPQVKDVLVELTFDPPWNPDKMSKKAKIKLGFQ